MNCYKSDHELSAAIIRDYPFKMSLRQSEISLKQTMRSVIEIPGDVPKNHPENSTMDKDREMSKTYNQKLGKKIFVGVLLLSSVIFCTVIILRYGGILKLRVHNVKIQNVIYQHRQNCVKFSICPRNK